MQDRTWHLLKASDKEIFGPTDLENSAWLGLGGKNLAAGQDFERRPPELAACADDPRVADGPAGANARQLPLRPDECGNDPGIPCDG
jgi:hypothetical protein